MRINWDLFWDQFLGAQAYKNVLSGLGTTLIIAVGGLLIGLVIGSVLAIFKLIPSKKPFFRILSAVSNVYVTLFRGTPMVVQLLIIHYVLFPAMGVMISSVAEATVAFGLNSGAYICEIMRGGILSVDKGQAEAGRALGLNYGQTLLSVVLPQAVKNVIPTLGNEFIALIKETSVVSFIAVVDLTRAFQNMANSTFEYMASYIMLALVYLVLVLIITLIIRLIERRLRASDRR